MSANETKVKAIVLGGIDYKEKDKLVTLFTLEHGIVSVIFRGVKNANAKLKSAKEMFSFGDFIFLDGKFKTVISADIIDSFFDITKDIKKYYIACAIIEIVKAILPQGDVNSELFLNTLKSLKLLAYETVDPLIVLNKFLICAFEGFGYKFDTNVCNNCGITLLNKKYMNLNYGDITCSNCKVGEYIELSKPVYSVIRLFSITDFDKILTLKIPEQINRQVYEILKLNFYNRFNKIMLKIL